MTTDVPDSSIEIAVCFLNVDVDMYGVFDRAALLSGLGDSIFVLHNREDSGGGPVLSFELNADTPALAETISGLVDLIHALPDAARSAWDLASRRVFNIGIQAGLEPHSTEWVLSGEIMASLVAIKADVVLTLYGANNGPSNAPADQ